MIRHLTICGALWLCGCGGATAPDTTTATTKTDGSCNYHVYRHDPNGWLQSTVEMSLVSWGSYWMDNRNDAGSFFTIWTSLFANEVLARLSQYGIKGGTLNGNMYRNNPNTSVPLADGGTISQDPDGGMTYLDDSGIPTEINNEIQAGLLPSPNDNTMYMILLPPNVTTNKLVLAKSTGYHGSATSYDGARYTYGIITYQSETVGMDILMSHELYEAVTDPDAYTGWFDDKTTNEVGDFCESLTVQVGNFAVQKLWDQTACECL